MLHAAGWPVARIPYSRPRGVGLLLLLLLLLTWPVIKRKLFSRVTLISKVQSTSDLHARDLPCSRVKSHDDPISDCRGDSAVPYCFIYIKVYNIFTKNTKKLPQIS